MIVMGIRMFIKYRHNQYQIVRTASVLFFQIIFALHMAQTHFAFVHHDLHAKNILVKKLEGLIILQVNNKSKI